MIHDSCLMLQDSRCVPHDSCLRLQSSCSGGFLEASELQKLAKLSSIFAALPVQAAGALDRGFKEASEPQKVAQKALRYATFSSIAGLL